ncbi:unnamed protein product, partial [Meganyctiphanes norvegica]
LLFICDVPTKLFELVKLVQNSNSNRSRVTSKILCSYFSGAGVGTVIMSFLLGTYYNVIIAWTIFYLFQSFNKAGLPWSDCSKPWAANSTTCFDATNTTASNNSNSPTQEFFDKVLLQKTSGIDDPGEIRLELVLALFFAWILVYFSLWKSIKSSGKVVYVTATVPYLLIGIFLWRALTLPGAYLGLQYFFKPKWELLLKAEVWVNAAAQNFNSIGIAFGSLIAFSSYNKRSNNIILDTWAISLTNAFTSLLAGLIVFSTLGNIAQEQGKDIDEVVAQGPGLVFVVYPQALAKFPYANIWAALFFFMLLILGLDSQFATVEVIVTSLKDGFPNWIRKYIKRHEILVLIVCLVSFLLGLPNVTQGGIYFFQLIDYYAAAVSLMYLAFFEVIAVVWVYGANRLAHNVKEMTGRMPSAYFRYCWYFIAPILIMAIWLFSMIDYSPPTYNKGEYHYPPGAIALGWCIAMLSIGPIPVFAVIAVIKAKGNTFMEKLRNSLRSQIDGCPCCGRPDNCRDASLEKHNGADSYPISLKIYGEQIMVAIDKVLSQDLTD